jgi:glucosyl-3-phosphoglycerate synthase
MEKDLCEFKSVQPIALVLPALYSEFEGSAMPAILEEISRVPYLNQVLVTLGKAEAHEFAEARRRVAGVHPNVRVIWNDGPRIQKMYRDLEAVGLSVGGDGKGRSCWLAYGYVLAGGHSKIIALHDCDIVNYSREMLARLCYPVADIRIDFAFSKGYYARVGDRMYGRATRLLRMTLEITKTLFRTLAAEGVLLSEGHFRALQAQYIRTAEDTIVNYHADAMLNGLAFDRHAEEQAVHAFAHGVRLAAESYLADPLGAPLIPNWNRVVAAVPDIFARLDEAVEADNT